MLDDQDRWNRAHAAAPDDERPSGFLREVFEQFSTVLPRGRALDIACGKGRNALFLAQRGFEVTAIDISPVALEIASKRAAEISVSVLWKQQDLENIELGHECYDLVINFNYLQRSLFRQIQRSLRPGGFVIFETYLLGQQAIGYPKNPAYLLGYNELLNAFRDFRVLWYREGKFSDGGDAAYRASLCAEKQ
jgi:2-polyprenyl-3-methyl-5-hydroxy-6-metoxy-1,4-benzoquinol methylase